jgi:L-ascorbate metabolism protein UlaG (beta-lactamase superfamily)
LIHIEKHALSVSACKSIKKNGKLFAWWLGQSGFLFSDEGYNILIDPYLSDALAKKYKGTLHPHTRLMQPPIGMEEITSIHAVLCTHAHSDHMDPELFPTLLENNPGSKIVIPASSYDTAINRGAKKTNIVTINHGENIELLPGLSVNAIASAHETLETNTSGEHLYLGYILNLNDFTIYHSGDNCPYDGLIENLQHKKIDLAMLPVNGRGKGVKGNFSFEEAVDISFENNIPNLIIHHFGMFGFNTVTMKALKKAQRDHSDKNFNIFIPEMDVAFVIDQN